MVDFGPLESSVHIGCFDCELHKATIVMAVALPAAAGSACRSLSESFGALEASLREASNAPSMARRRQACPARSLQQSCSVKPGSLFEAFDALTCRFKKLRCF